MAKRKGNPPEIGSDVADPAATGTDGLMRFKPLQEPEAEPADITNAPAGEQVVTLIAPRGTTSVGCHGANPGDPSRVLPVVKGTGQVKVPARYAQRLIEDHGFKEL